MMQCLFLEGNHKTKQNPYSRRRVLSLYHKGCPRVAGGGQGGVHHLSHLDRQGTWDNSPKDGGAAPWQILDVTFFQQLPLNPNEFGPKTSVI